ncbi:MAG: DUF1573 domain-containing protein [Bacteroidales bacterium]|nr:DUF1573 domain-containing protein [Bacteroidales bacterium]
MKRSIILFCLITAFVAIDCTGRKNENDSSSPAGFSADGKAEISFREYEHDFGKVAEGEKIAYVFTFENSGTTDLVIKSASSTCGCTVPKYDTRPVSPGKGGNLEVVFDTSGRSGQQTKTITVKSNASKPVVLLKITAEVVTNIN